jgi:tetratricopeptide (TPR) repeat protein
LTAITPIPQSDAEDLLQRVADLLESANSCQRQEHSGDADSLIAKAKQLAAGNQNASAMVDLFCATTLLEQGIPEQGLQALASMLTEHREWLATDEGREMYEFIQVQRAFSLVHLGKILEARPLLEQSTQFELNGEVRSDVHCHLGRCYHELGLYKLAREQFERANTLGVSEEWQPVFHYYYGYTLYELKEFQRAKREFTLCLQSGSSGPEPTLRYAMLAAVSRKLGEHAEAAAFEQQAKALKR